MPSRVSARAAFRTLTEGYRGGAGGDPQYSWNTAQCFGMLDEKEESLRWLKNAVSLGFINYPLFAEQDPFLANIRGTGVRESDGRGPTPVGGAGHLSRARPSWRVRRGQGWLNLVVSGWSRVGGQGPS